MKYIPTTHSKVRYSERVDFRKNMKDSVIKALKYGIKLKDIPLEFEQERSFIGENKVYFEEYLYIFTTRKFRQLITVYHYESELLNKLYLEKKHQRQVYLKDEERKFYKFKIINFRGDYYRIIYYKNKLIEFKTIYFGKSKITVKTDEIVEVLNRYFNGAKINLSRYVSFKNMTKEEIIVFTEVVKIPYGKALTYTELLNKIGNVISKEKLIKILKKCRLLYFIPTHRVFGDDGQIGVYCGRGKIKKELTTLENKNKNKGKTLEENVECENDFVLNIGKLFNE